MVTIRRTVRTSASATDAWSFMSDFRTTEEWDPPTQRTTRLSGDGGVGSVYENVSHLMRRDTRIIYTVTKMNEPHEFELQGEHRFFSEHDHVQVQASGSGAVVTYTAQFTFKGLAKLITPVAAFGLKRLGDRSARQMGTRLDSLG